MWSPSLPCKGVKKNVVRTFDSHFELLNQKRFIYNTILCYFMFFQRLNFKTPFIYFFILNAFF